MKLESISKDEIVAALIVASAYFPDPSDLTEDSYDDYQRPHIRTEYDFVSELLSQLGLSFDERDKALNGEPTAICSSKLDTLSKKDLFKGLMISSTYLPHAEDINTGNFDGDELPRLDEEFNIVVDALGKAGITVDDALKEFAIDYPQSSTGTWKEILCDNK
tara:strand:- start:25852 stop:26337 length:486 start_codon:yes stop_codon:yes gene_type:complete